VAELEAEHQRVAADIAALDRRVRVLRDAEPTRPSGDAKPERERARREAVTTMRLQARLLCASATLLSEPITAERKAPTELAEALEQLAALDAALAEGPAAVPIDGAMRARAACLRALTAVRSKAPAAAGTGPDALLEALSKAGHGAPRRDDRGVVVTLRHVFAGDGLSAKGRAALSAVAQVAKAHADVPLMLVLHQSKPLDDKAEKRWQDRAGILSQALSSAGARVGRVEMAGAAAPLVDPRGRHRARNERVELVFVARKPL
jgi:hypothetical protein